MRPAAPQDLDLLGEVFGLLMSCPFLGGNPQHCQLRDVRLLPLEDRLAWARTISASDARALKIRSAGCARCLAHLNAQAGRATHAPGPESTSCRACPAPASRSGT